MKNKNKAKRILAQVIKIGVRPYGDLSEQEIASGAFLRWVRMGIQAGLRGGGKNFEQFIKSKSSEAERECQATHSQPNPRFYFEPTGAFAYGYRIGYKQATGRVLRDRNLATLRAEIFADGSRRTPYLTEEEQNLQRRIAQLGEGSVELFEKRLTEFNEHGMPKCVIQ